MRFYLITSRAQVKRGHIHFTRTWKGQPCVIPSAPLDLPLPVDTPRVNAAPADTGPEGEDPSAEARPRVEVPLDPSEVPTSTAADDNDGDGDGGGDGDDCGDDVGVPPAPLVRGDQGKLVETLQFMLVQAGFLRPTAIRFHAGSFGGHTQTAVGAMQVRKHSRTFIYKRVLYPTSCLIVCLVHVLVCVFGFTNVGLTPSSLEPEGAVRGDGDRRV